MSGRRAAFLVQGKTFAYYLDDHHGDGIVALVCKMAAGENAVLIAADPHTFYLPSYVGPKGWVAMRLDKGVNWDLAGELVSESYELIAPKRPAARKGAQANVSQYTRPR